MWRHLDESRWPIVVGTFPGFADVDDYFRELRECIARGQRYAMVTDSSSQLSAHALERKKIADFVRETAEASDLLCMGSAVIVSGAVARGVLTAIFWVTPHNFPLVVARDLPHGLEIARGWLEKEKGRRRS